MGFDDILGGRSPDTTNEKISPEKYKRIKKEFFDLAQKEDADWEDLEAFIIKNFEDLTEEEFEGLGEAIDNDEEIKGILDILP